jgi:hypothetical protein
MKRDSGGRASGCNVGPAGGREVFDQNGREREESERHPGDQDAEKPKAGTAPAVFGDGFAGHAYYRRGRDHYRNPLPLLGINAPSQEHGGC